MPGRHAGFIVRRTPLCGLAMKTFEPMLASMLSVDRFASLMAGVEQNR